MDSQIIEYDQQNSSEEFEHLCKELSELIGECKECVVEASTMQQAAVSDLRAHFTSLIAQTSQHQASAEQGQASLFNIITCLQFDDLNEQKLRYTADLLQHIQTLLLHFDPQQVSQLDTTLHQQLLSIRHWRQSRRNAVSSSDVQQGDIEFF